MTTAPDQTETLRAGLAGRLGFPALRLAERPALDHQSNRLYDAWQGGTHLIVKEFLLADHDLEAPWREYAALERLAGLDVAPRPVLYAPAGTLEGAGPLVVYEYLEGAMWDRGDRVPEDLAALARAWLAINHVPSAGLWLARGQAVRPAEIARRLAADLAVYTDWAAGDYPAGLEAVERWHALLARRQSIVAALEADEPVLCFCRLDPRFANVIGRPDGRVGLVDWEDSGLRDAARDLADLLTHANQEDIVPPAVWPAFLEPYLAGRRSADPNLWDRAHLYLALFPLYWLSRLLRVGAERARNAALTGWSINGRPPNWRLRRYLARATAWPDPDFSRALATAQTLTFFPGVE